MTAMLACDGCGAIVSDRPEDDDPTGQWWALSPAPSISGLSLMPTIALGVDLTMEADDEVPFDQPEDLPPLEKDRHFCSIPCVGRWVERRQEETEDR